ncbi:MAG: hypothetical protein ACJ8HI_13695 [Massilia sp.]|jgi:hypothetical protein
MTDPTASPWWVVAMASLPSIASGFWVSWRWWVERGDKLHDGTLTREERIQRDLDDQRMQLSKRDAEWFDRLRIELARTEEKLKETEADRDRGWALARYWHRYTHELFRQFRNIAHDTANVMQWAVWVKKHYPDVEMPQVEIPPRQEPPMNLEDPLKQASPP